MSLHFLWDKIFDYGVFVRTNNLDGLESWRKIKNLLQKYNCGGEWLSEAISRYDEMKIKFNIEDIEKTESTDYNEWEKTHFFFQHARIPFNSVKDNDANLIRLMQIAYNAGQLKVVEQEEQNVLHPIYTQERKDYYQRHNLSSYISYMTPSSLNKMNLEIAKKHQALSEIDNIMQNQLSGGYKKQCIYYMNRIKKIK
jgi:hypothetical protein